MVTETSLVAENSLVGPAADALPTINVTSLMTEFQLEVYKKLSFCYRRKLCISLLNVIMRMQRGDLFNRNGILFPELQHCRSEISSLNYWLQHETVSVK